MKNIFIDFDNVIVNSTKVITSMLNNKYEMSINWRDVKQYDFKDKFPNVNKSEIQNMFESELFFKLAPVSILDDSQNVIRKLCNDFNVFILSIGTPKNIELKMELLKTYFPFVKNYIMIVKYDTIMDKSIIKMNKEDWIIDDVYSNIETSSAGNRILFGVDGIETEWNKYGKLFELTINWKDVKRRIYGNNNDMQSITTTR